MNDSDARPGSPRDFSREEPCVPAVVLCAVCGSSECTGCEPAERLVPAGIPWEGGTGGPFSRLWSTARLASIDGEAFFGGIQKGSIGNALAFAALCELCAITSLFVVFLPLSYALVPETIAQIALDPARLTPTLAVLGISVPLLAGLMVLLHLIWGGTLELGVRFAGDAAEPAQGLRYALYACGWDLLTSPFGLVAAWLTSGLRTGALELRAALKVPRSATRAYLRRARGLTGRPAKIALVFAAVLTGAFVASGAVVLGVAIVVAML